jgi:hypothetical protein
MPTGGRTTTRPGRRSSPRPAAGSRTSSRGSERAGRSPVSPGACALVPVSLILQPDTALGIEAQAQGVGHRSGIYDPGVADEAQVSTRMRTRWCGGWHRAGGWSAFRAAQCQRRPRCRKRLPRYRMDFRLWDQHRPGVLGGTAGRCDGDPPRPRGGNGLMRAKLPARMPRHSSGAATPSSRHDAAEHDRRAAAALVRPPSRDESHASRRANLNSTSPIPITRRARHNGTSTTRCHSYVIVSVAGDDPRR